MAGCTTPIDLQLACMSKTSEFFTLIIRDGPGNFGLLPNGVFALTKKEFMILETEKFARSKIRCQYATQSGPLLVIDGKIHPKFIKDGASKFVRSRLASAETG